MTLAEIAAVVDGTPADDGQSVTVTGPAFVDSRLVEPGGLFVAIPGERVDGHDYATGAVAAGAAAVLAARPTGVPTVVVGDPVTALGVLARHVVDALPHVTVLALTGSQGKTGTKDYLAQVLAQRGPTVATRGNFNNEIGVPLTVLRATAETRFLVVEMGARGLGHIAHLCTIAPPRVAAVLNIGTAHLAEFGSRDAIARAKGEILEALPSDGVAVVSAEDPWTATMATRTSARTVRFGVTGDVRWRSVTTDDLARPSFELGHHDTWCPVTLSQPGAHQVLNAAAAAAMALGAGSDLTSVAAALSASTASSRWRMELHERADGSVVINDAYNANPESMEAAIDTLAAIGRSRRGRGRTIAVLGVMLELGTDEERAHRRVGRFLGVADVDVVVTVGGVAEAIAAGARDVTTWGGEAIITASRDEALARVRENVRAGDVVLVKASRGAALEHVVAGMLADEERTR